MACWRNFDDLDDQVHYWNTNITDENLPLKKMRDKSDSNWDKLRKCHNEAKRQRQRAIKSCWRDKSNHLKENPADFYRTFMPFLSSKASKKSSQLNLKVGEEIARNQDEVAETLAGYFVTIADDIVRENV
ncbi:unnamed protein product, partial [Porites evermanni]